MTKWTEIADKILARWGSQRRGLWSREGAGKLLAISLGLGALFDEDEQAECSWMWTHRDALGATPLQAVLDGRIDLVVNLVNQERGL